MSTENKKIRMLVIPSDRTGVGKFRSIDPHTYIQAHYPDEFDIDIVYIEDIPHDTLPDFLGEYDLIHIHKRLDSNMEIMNTIAFLGIPTIVDIDDYYFLGDDHPLSFSSKRENWHVPIIKHLKAATCVTTTTPIYANELLKHNKNVVVLENAIDPNEPQFNDIKIPSNRLRFGLICGSTHLNDIRLMGGLADLGKDVLSKIQFVLCGFDTRGITTVYGPNGEVQRRDIRPEESVWVRYEEFITDNYKLVSPEHKAFLKQYIPWMDDPFTDEPYRRFWTRDINKYGTHYQNVDVLLAPLKENDFNKMKSQLKEIEAGFMHTALIADKFGPYTVDTKSMLEKSGVVNEDGNCLLVEPSKNHKQWAKYITILANNPEMVTKLQNNLHEWVKDRYSLENVCKKRVELYKKLVSESNKNC